MLLKQKVARLHSAVSGVDYVLTLSESRPQAHENPLWKETHFSVIFRLITTKINVSSDRGSWNTYAAVYPYMYSVMQSAD
jgi:hypothetical protein